MISFCGNLFIFILMFSINLNSVQESSEHHCDFYFLIHQLSRVCVSYLMSKKISLRSRLARNMNMLLCSLISVIPLGGSE